MKSVLLDKVRDPVAEPLEQIEEFTDTRFLLASIGMPIDGTGSVIANGQIDISIPPIRNPGIDSIWIKIPLTEAEVAQELADWRAHLTGGPVIEQLQGEGPQSAGAEQSLSAESEAKWYQLTPTESGDKHELEFGLGDSNQRSALAEKFPKMYMFVVQQNGSRAVSFVKDGVGRVFVDDQLIRDPDVFTAPVIEEGDTESSDSN